MKGKLIQTEKQKKTQKKNKKKSKKNPNPKHIMQMKWTLNLAATLWEKKIRMNFREFLLGIFFAIWGVCLRYLFEVRFRVLKC